MGLLDRLCGRAHVTGSYAQRLNRAAALILCLCSVDQIDMHHSKNSHSGQRSTRHCSTTFQLKSKLKYILIIEILDQDPHSYWALNPEFESFLCLILNPDVLLPVHGVQRILFGLHSVLLKGLLIIYMIISGLIHINIFWKMKNKMAELKYILGGFKRRLNGEEE